MFTIVAYDIADDRRRVKIATILEDYGVRVQYSVFECDITDKQFGLLQKRLVRYIKEGDSLRIYRICTVCKERIRFFGEGKFTRDSPYYLV